MKQLLCILTSFILFTMPGLAQEETLICPPPYLIGTPESEILLAVDDLYFPSETFSNRVRFEHAYNLIQLEIRITQINAIAAENDVDASVFIAQDPLIARINAENADTWILANRVLDDLTVDALLWRYAEDNNLSVSADFLDETISDFFDTTEANAEEQQTIVEQFAGRIIANGTPLAEMDTFFCRQALYELVQNSVIGETETALYVNVDHILLSNQEVALDIINLINEGADFATLAQELSLDTGSAQQGGSLGWQPVVFYVSEFADAVTTGEIGTLLAPIQTQFGWHVVRINGREERPVEGNLREQIINTQFNQWREEQISNASISINPDWQSFIPEL